MRIIFVTFSFFGLVKIRKFVSIFSIFSSWISSSFWTNFSPFWKTPSFIIQIQGIIISKIFCLSSSNAQKRIYWHFIFSEIKFEINCLFDRVSKRTTKEALISLNSRHYRLIEVLSDFPFLFGKNKVLLKVE